LRSEQRAAELRRTKAIKDKEHQDRVTPVVITEKCKQNPLAKGCM
jgi:hypothetical protein